MMTTTNDLTYKVNIRSADEVSPSALDSNPVVSYNKRGVKRGVGAWTSITLIESSNIKRGNKDNVGVTDGSLTNLY